MESAVKERPTGIESTPLCANLGWLLSQANHAMTTEMTSRLEGIGLYPRNFCVIQTAMEGELTQTEIAQTVGLDKTTMVTSVDELEAAGLVERVPSPTDRRARIIRVTREGAAKAEEAKRIVADLQEEILDSLPAAQRKGLMSGLLTLVGDRLAEPAECSRAVRRRD
ncbi:MAG: MarR family winged helix-turn-helix transcriptional regulator [Solirubrobacterales bacterium]